MWIVGTSQSAAAPRWPRKSPRQFARCNRHPIMNELMLRFLSHRAFQRPFFRFLLGLAVGLLIHYFLYRIFLPVQPFIYVAF
jgi:hypothetical protein